MQASTFPGGALGDDILLTQGRLFRGVTLNEEGVYAFVFMPKNQAGNAGPTAGIYSIAPGETEFTRHLSFSDTLFDGFENSLAFTEGAGTSA